MPRALIWKGLGGPSGPASRCRLVSPHALAGDAIQRGGASTKAAAPQQPLLAAGTSGGGAPSSPSSSYLSSLLPRPLPNLLLRLANARVDLVSC